MQTLKTLLDNNKNWAAKIQASDPEFFVELSRQQSPEYLWIGCSDSRVPANQIVGLLPGEIFVHRNVANLVVHTDFNCLSVIQFAVEVLRVKHIIVCGHYSCGGVQTAIHDLELGLIDNWLRHIKDVYHKYQEQLATYSQDNLVNKLCELNVIEQVNNVCHTPTLQHAWKRKQPVTVHGLIYGLNDGLLKDLQLSISSREQISELQKAVKQVL